jgi:uncharacterized protein (UPF0297 family)
MFDLIITEEVNNLLKKVRKALKEKGYKKSISRTNRHIGTMHYNLITEYYIKGNMVFEFERDLNENIIRTFLHYNGHIEEFNLADVLNVA